jgi:hypothetical protein
MELCVFNVCVVGMWGVLAKKFFNGKLNLPSGSLMRSWGWPAGGGSWGACPSGSHRPLDVERLFLAIFSSVFIFS